MTTDISSNSNDLDLPSDEDREFGRVKPWPEPVDGVKLLNEIVATLHEYIVCDDHMIKRDALWVMLTWFSGHPDLDVFPLLAILAAAKGCGKTRYLELLGELVHKPIYVGNSTVAAVFRMTDERNGPTLLMDEWDSLSPSVKAEMTNLLNNGYRRKSARIHRAGSKDGKSTRGLESYNVYGPKILCGIGRLPATVKSRCQSTTLERKAKGRQIRNLGPASRKHFGILNRKIARWVADSFDRYGEALSVAWSTDKIGNRDGDNSVPLRAIAILVGGDWPKIADKIMALLSVVDRDDPEVAEEALRDLLLAFTEYGDTELATRIVIERMCDNKEKRWASYNGYNRPIIDRQLAGLLKKRFRVSSRQLGPENSRYRGYVLDENLLAQAKEHAAPDDDEVVDLRSVLLTDIEKTDDEPQEYVSQTLSRADMLAELHSDDEEELPR